MPSLLKRSFFGALLGAMFSIAGAILSVARYGGRLADQPLPYMISICAAIGAISGAVFESLRAWRKRGRLGHLLSWTVAVGAGAAVVATPSAFADKSWIDWVFVTALGLTSGFGLGLFAEEVRRRG